MARRGPFTLRVHSALDVDDDCPGDLLQPFHGAAEYRATVSRFQLSGRRAHRRHRLADGQAHGQ